MVARKSSRVKKTTVVYQAPEQVPRSHRNTPQKTAAPRRSFNREIELYMECVDDELSPAQLKAIKEAQKEHEKANDLIKEVRAGNTLVPSSQPNTFTIVPPKPSPAPPKPLPAPKAQAPVFMSAPVPQDTGSQRGLPPPRPAQFLSKQLQEMKKSSGSRVSPEVILLSDTSTSAQSTGKMTPVNVPVAHISGSSVPVQQMNSLLASTGSGVAAHQVYKFVSLPSNMPANIVSNQWQLKPVLAGVQQTQMTLVSPTSQAITNVTQVPAGRQSQEQMPAQRSTASVKYVKTDNASPALKRPSPMEASTLQPPSKKKPMNQKVSETSDLTGNWVPLDEYYYGTHEGDTSYTEEKGEYRFKCWYCSKMLYNNVRAMQHIQGHIDASKQQNIDLSDLTQCKYCYKQFDTPFEMQTHVEKVHLSNKVLMCRICEKDFSTPFQLTVHMKSNHQACEMPYVCHLCNFRSSMYSDVVDHFKKKHDSSHYMLCLYCLRTFEVKFVNQGWGQTQTYYGHLLKHQTKSATKKCVVCRLTFFNTQDVKNHRKNCHMGHFKDVKVFSPGGKADSGQKTRKGSNLKSLNAPSVSRIQDYGDIIFPAEASNTKCVECKMMMSSTDHYKKYVHCSMCRFATSCSIAYANHMMGFHSGQMSSLNLNIPWERPMKEVMYCACGFSSKYGNKIANHLVYCGKWTSYSTKRSYSKVSPGAAGEKKEEGSILGMLGLVQKSSVATIKDSDEIRSKPKLDSKPKEITSREVDEMEDDVNKKSVTIQLSDEKQGSEIQSGKTVSDDIKDNEKKEDIVTDKSNKFEEYLDKPKEISETKITSDTNEKVKDAEKDKTIKEQDIINLDSEDEASENTKSGETEPESIKLGNEAEMADKETEKEMATVTTETSFFSPTENERIKTKDQETVSEQDLKTETVVDVTYEKEEKMSASELRDTNEKFTTDGKHDSEIPSVEEIMDSESDLKEESPKVESENKEEMETFNKEKKQKEPETSIELHKVDEILEQEAEKQSSWTSSEEKSEDVDMDVDSVSMDTGDNVGDKVEIVKDVTETIADIEDHTEEDITEEKTKHSQQEQEVAEPSMDVEESSNAKEEKEHKDDEKPYVEKEHKEQEEDSKDGSVSQKESGNDVDKEKSTERASSNDQSSSSDRRSQDRHRDSSERHSTERRDSRDRHHSGSSERYKYDDRSRHDDRYRQENRSHGSDRSDSYHGKRSRNDQNRDRSYDRDRDRDRDCNRNRDQRHGDSRSGHGYQDNRGNGGQGHRSHQGHYGGYQGNRGDQYQDRNRGGNNQDRSYNRNYQNRGGYNQNYRGNYRGGYY